MSGAASLTQLSPLAAPWRGWLLFLVARAPWKPSTRLSVARAEEEEGAGVGWGCDPAPWPPWPWAALQHVALAPGSRGDTKHSLGSLVLMFSGS